MEEILYNVKEVAKLFRTNVAYVYRLIDAKQLPVLKIGSMKIRKSAVDKFLEENVGNDLTDPFNIKKLQ